MKKYLKILKPNRFEDLIAMNALYRPGPMDYIRDLSTGNTAVKKSNTIFPHGGLSEDTYGITVYQEQVMLLSSCWLDFRKEWLTRYGKQWKENRFDDGCP